MVVVEVNGYEIEPRADLEGADLTAADLRGANLAESFADEETVWPGWFDAIAAGVIFD